MILGCRSMEVYEVSLMRKIQNSTMQDAALSAAQPPYESSSVPQIVAVATGCTSNDAGTRAMERLLQLATGDAVERALDLCEVRMERVERIRGQIAAGTYRVSSRALAERLVRNMLGDYR